MLSASRFVRILTRYVACFQCPRGIEPTIGTYIVVFIVRPGQTFQLSGQPKRL